VIKVETFMDSRILPRHLRLWRLVSIIDMPAMVVGALAAISGHRWGAYLLVVNLVVQICFHLLVGAWAYRDVMTRPWPSVSPLEDDDWDD
jgi:hypothetical protein